MFLGWDQRRQLRAAAGCGRPAGSRLCSPAGGAYGAPGRRPQPHRATQRRTWPGRELKLKGPGAEAGSRGGSEGEACYCPRHHHRAGGAVELPASALFPRRTLPLPLGFGAEPCLLTRALKTSQLRGLRGGKPQGGWGGQKLWSAPESPAQVM